MVALLGFAAAFGGRLLGARVADAAGAPGARAAGADDGLQVALGCQGQGGRPTGAAAALADVPIPAGQSFHGVHICGTEDTRPLRKEAVLLQ